MLSAILSSLLESMLSQEPFMSTSHEVWTPLERMFSFQSCVWAMQIRAQLANIKKRDTPAADYFNKVKRLAGTLASIGKPLRDEEFISFLLAGLNEDCDSLVTSMTTRVDPISINDMFAYLLSHELRIDRCNSGLHIDEHYTNFTTNSNHGGGGTPNPRCRGHDGGSRGRNNHQRGGNNGGNTSNRLMCQV